MPRLPPVRVHWLYAVFVGNRAALSCGVRVHAKGLLGSTHRLNIIAVGHRRWTHEELRWLPRRERDKRRIIKEGWYRTKWGGWSPGSGN